MGLWSSNITLAMRTESSEAYRQFGKPENIEKEILIMQSNTYEVIINGLGISAAMSWCLQYLTFQVTLAVQHLELHLREM